MYMYVTFKRSTWKTRIHMKINIGIKHVFPCINIRWALREVLKTESADDFYIDILVPGPSDINTSHRKQLLNHGGKLTRIHHMVGEFTKCSGCLLFILIVDNSIHFTFRPPV